MVSIVILPVGTTVSLTAVNCEHPDRSQYSRPDGGIKFDHARDSLSQGEGGEFYGGFGDPKGGWVG